MKSLIGIFLIVFCATNEIIAQAVFNNTGNWETAGNWLGSDIGDMVTEDVTFSNNKSALINNGSTYTVGNITFGNSDGLTINTTGILNVGASGTPKDFTAGNGSSITVTGTLVIWGDLIVVNNLSLNVSGSLIIKGNIQMNNGASISVTGSVQVDGDFIAGNNADVSISGGGHINVDGTVTIGMNGNLTGPPGSFTAGDCSEGGGSNFCSGGVLPVELLFFKATATTKQVSLSWATASELNSDYFIVEKSDDGLSFETLAKVEAQGNSTVKINYEAIDEKPIIGKTYYRLKEVDLQGKETMFHVNLVEFTGLRATSIYPNPIDNGQNLTLELNFIPQYPLEVSLFDLSGKRIERLIIKNNLTALPIQLNQGMYILRVSSPEYSSLSKFLVK